MSDTTTAPDVTTEITKTAPAPLRLELSVKRKGRAWTVKIKCPELAKVAATGFAVLGAGNTDWANYPESYYPPTLKGCKFVGEEISITTTNPTSAAAPEKLTHLLARTLKTELADLAVVEYRVVG